MIDTSQPGSPGWWLDRLAKKLVERRSNYEKLDRYYSGEAMAPSLASKGTRRAYAALCSMSRLNLSELVVEAVRERMQVQAFRTGAEGDENGDAEAWRIWQANALDADAVLVHRASLSMGCGYVIVGGVDPEIGAPLITPEDPRDVIAEHDRRRRRKVVAALKLDHDDWSGRDVAYLYLPGVVFRAVRTSSTVAGEIAFDAHQWSWLDDEPDELPVPVVPVVAFPNRAALRKPAGVGEFEPHLPILDRINFTILQRAEIATLQAFRQRAVKGVPAVDNEGNQVNYADVFASDPSALWILPQTAEVWESQQVDLTPIRAAIRDDVQDLAAVTRTPLFYLAPDAANGSAEGASLAREGLVFKTTDRIVQAGESWEAVMSLAFLFAGDEQRASRGDLEAVWASPERFSLAERYDAATKAGAAGVPWSTVMRSVLGFGPQEIARMAAERASDAFLAGVTALGAPQPTAPAAAPVLDAEA